MAEPTGGTLTGTVNPCVSAFGRHLQRVVGRRLAARKLDESLLLRHHFSAATQIGIEVLVLGQPVVHVEDPFGVVGVQTRLEN